MYEYIALGSKREDIAHGISEAFLIVGRVNIGILDTFSSVGQKIYLSFNYQDSYY